MPDLNDKQKYYPSVDPLGVNPNPVPAANTDMNKTEKNTETQIQQQAHAKNINAAKQQNYANEKNGMVGGVIPSPVSPLPTWMQAPQNIRQPKTLEMPAIVQNMPQETVPETPAEETPQDTQISTAQQLLADLEAKNDANRKKYEQQKASDKIGRLGFALGQLMGAKSGSKAVTLDSNETEYEKDFARINKENEDYYKRALELINDEYARQYNADKLAADREKAQATLEENKRVNDARIDYYKQQGEYLGTKGENDTKKTDAAIEQNNKKVGIQQQNANTAATRAATGAQNANTAAARESRLAGGSTTSTTTEKTDNRGRTTSSTTTKVTKPNSGGSSGRRSSSSGNSGAGWDGTLKKNK